MTPAATNASKPYQREHYRVPLPVAYPVMFAGPATIGEGTVTNLSVSGCTIECGAPPAPASRLLLRLLLPDQQDSLAIDGAEVKWVEGGRVGVVFTKIARAADLRLHGFVWDRMIERLTAIKQGQTAS